MTHPRIDAPGDNLRCDDPVVNTNCEPTALQARRDLGGRIQVLDPLRAIAALAVAWFHFTNCSSLVKTEWLRQSGAYGWLGVQVFFVVSGFIIPYSMYCGGYDCRKHYWHFLGKRLLRLEPCYLVSIMLALLLMQLARTAGIGGEKALPSVAHTLLHVGYLNTFFGYEWINPVYWTLGIEFQYYLIIALLYPLIVARSAAVRVLCIIAMCMLSLAVQAPALVVHYLALFALGIVSFQYRIGLLSKPAFLAFFGAIAVGLLLKFNIAITLVGVVTSALIVFNPVSHHPAWKVVAVAGLMSYSFYLIHTMIGGPVTQVASKYDGGVVWELAVLALAIVVSAGVAAVFYRVIEVPSQYLSSRIKFARETAQSGVNPVVA
jgi:peptidoglycan/LPS O-acetylase OafA/YrhL